MEDDGPKALIEALSRGTWEESQLVFLLGSRLLPEHVQAVLDLLASQAIKDVDAKESLIRGVSEKIGHDEVPAALRFLQAHWRSAHVQYSARNPIADAVSRAAGVGHLQLLQETVDSLVKSEPDSADSAVSTYYCIRMTLRPRLGELQTLADMGNLSEFLTQWPDGLNTHEQELRANNLLNLAEILPEYVPLIIDLLDSGKISSEPAQNCLVRAIAEKLLPEHVPAVLELLASGQITSLGACSGLGARVWHLAAEEHAGALEKALDSIWLQPSRGITLHIFRLLDSKLHGLRSEVAKFCRPSAQVAFERGSELPRRKKASILY